MLYANYLIKTHLLIIGLFILSKNYFHVIICYLFYIKNKFFVLISLASVSINLASVCISLALVALIKHISLASGHYLITSEN